MSEVLLEKRGHTVLLTLNRPQTLNALCVPFMKQIEAALDQVIQDPECYVLMITGSGRSFIAGADINEMYHLDSTQIGAWAKIGSNLNLKLEQMRIPTIAVINGYALGGGLELAMSCDIRLASEHARMGLPETTLGVICAAGGTQRLPRIVGEGTAKEMIFSGKTIDAQEALRIGLVQHVYSAEDLLPEAFALAESIERNGQIAVRTAKSAVNFSRHATIEDGCRYEDDLFQKLFDTEDQKIGMGGFLRKEKNIQFQNR